MANIRNLKKDIHFLTYEIISDCYTFMYLHPDKDTKKATEIISETLKTQDELIKRVNNIDVTEKKEIKAYFRKIYEDLLNKTDNSFTELSKLTK